MPRYAMTMYRNFKLTGRKNTLYIKLAEYIKHLTTIIKIHFFIKEIFYYSIIF